MKKSMIAAAPLGAPVKHLLVDLDGTLLGNRSVSLSFDFVGRAVSALRMYGGWSLAIRTLLSIYREFKLPSVELTNDKRVVEVFSRRMRLAPEEGRRVLRETLGKIFPELQRHFYPMEGAAEFLGWAKEHYTLTLATNPVWPSEIVKLRVQWAGLDPELFSFITDVRVMRACKPAPEYYREILAHRGFQAADCLLIGNDLKMDLPATNVGIRVFIVAPLERLEGIAGADTAAHAWRGNYARLRELLEAGIAPPSGPG